MSSRSRSATLQSSLLAASLAFATPALAADVTVTLPPGDGFVIEDNTGTIERLRVDEATGNISRNGALFVHTTGALTGSTYVGAGAGNLATLGTGNAAFGEKALASNIGGFYNAAFGKLALTYNSVGYRNSAFGAGALYDNTTGNYNSAFGQAALFSNTTGISNSAFGHFALHYNETAGANAAFGARALISNTAVGNSAFGYSALASNSTGSRNVALGYRAGRNQTTGSNNIYLANDGVAGESGQIKIGTVGTHTDTFLVGDVTTTGRLGVGTTNPTQQLTIDNPEGGTAFLTLKAFGNRELLIGVTNTPGGLISMQTNHGLDFRTNGTRRLSIQADGTIDSPAISTNFMSGVNVLINPVSDELGIAVSSARFKREIRDLGEASEALFALRPVAFRYRESDPGAPVEYGLIAEEVTAVAPDLVVYDEGGEPYAVRYQLLAPMLVNEVQRLAARVEELETKLAAAGGEDAR